VQLTRTLARLLLVLFVMSIIPWSGTPIKAASRKVSNLTAAGGKVYKLVATPDGNRVVYTAGYDRLNTPPGFAEDGLIELYSAPLTGDGSVLRLSSALTETGEVHNFQLTPDGSRVVFVYESLLTKRDQLYSVSVTGGTPVLIYNPPSIDSPMDEFQFTVSPDSTRVVFAYRPQAGDQKFLYSASILGGSVTSLNEYANGSFGRGRLYVDITPDSSTVIYSIDQTAMGRRLYRVPITGGQVIELSTGLTNNEGTSEFTISPNGQQVMYQVYGANGTSRMRIVPVAGGINIDLIDQVVPVFFTSDSQTIVYEYPFDTTKGLAKVPVSGGNPITLTQALNRFYDTKLDPTGNYAVSVISTTDTYTLVSVSLNNGTVTPLSDGFSSISNFSRIISPDGSRVVYLAKNGDFKQPDGLYSVPITGGTAVRLDDPGITAGGVFDVKLSLDGSRVIYTARVTSSGGLADIYSVPINDGTPVKLSTPLEPDVRAVNILGFGAPDRVFYSTTIRFVSSGPGTTVTNSIYTTNVAGSSSPTLIDRSRITLGDVKQYQLTSNRNYAVYLADTTVDEQFELFSVALPGGTPVKLSGTEPISTFKMSPNNDRVLFIENGALYSAALNTGNPTLIYQPPQISEIREYDFAAGQAVFRVQSDAGVSELYRAPLTGGAAIIVDDGVASFRATGTSRVIYQATLDNGFNALFSSTLEADPPTEVYSNSLAILSYEVSPSGTTVVYQVDGFPLVFPKTLYSTPIEGGAATAIFSDTNSIALQAYNITPTSQHILYTTQSGSVKQLNSIPIFGGASVPLVETFTDVEIGYEVSPSGTQVVYRLSPLSIGSSSFDNITLASIPIAGGTTTTLFTRDDQASITIPFAITNDSNRVAFLSEGELYSVAITSTTPLKLVSAQNNNRVSNFVLSPNSAAVAYVQAGSLLTIPLNGGTPTTFVQPTIPSTGVLDYQFIDNELLLYRGDLVKKGVFDLFIADAGNATPTFTTTTLPTSENAGSLTIPLRLSNPSLLSLSFSLRAVGGNALAGTDYTLPTTTVTFPAGTTEQSLTLNLLDPPGYQGERTLVLGLFPAETALAQAEPLATITITIADNEPATRYLYLPMLKK
jgi:hypothetical protein